MLRCFTWSTIWDPNRPSAPIHPQFRESPRWQQALVTCRPSRSLLVQASENFGPTNPLNPGSEVEDILPLRTSECKL